MKCARRRMTPRTGSPAIGAVVLGCLLLCAGPAAITASEDAEPSLDRARSLLRTDSRSAVAMLDALARAGDVRAQLLLGEMLIEGKDVPQDRPLGLAFLQVAASTAEWMFNEATHDQVRALVLHYQFEMPGSELVRADQLAGAIAAEQDRNALAELKPALMRYTDQAAVRARPGIAFATEPVQIAAPPPAAEDHIMRLGCASERGKGCDRGPVGQPGHCTGRLPVSDASATSMAKDARIIAPGLRTGKSGTAYMLAHVDSSGWVCSVVVARSAGDTRLDAAALEAARQWKWRPARKAGVPVESLKAFEIAFRPH